MTGLSGLMPKGFKSSPVYRQLKDNILKVTAPVAPATMTTEERTFVEESQVEDIAWYEDRFAILNKVD